MLDTIKVKSPELPSEVLDRIAEQMQTRMCVDNASGEVLTEFTNGSLAGSFDHRTRVEVCRQELRAVPLLQELNNSINLRKCGMPRRPEFKLCECSHLIIEGSVHKAIQGINICGGPADPRAAIRWYVAMVAAGFGVQLPDGDEWEVMRIDVAECFDLGSYAACDEYLSLLRLAQFPRRMMSTHGNQTVGFYGTTTAWKVYHKGPEFWKHDRKRMVPFFDAGAMNFLQNYANGILRVETSIKLKKLQNDHHGVCLVKNVTAAYVDAVWDQETEKVIRESEQDMKTVRENHEVRIRLYEFYGQTKGGHLYGTWLSLSAVGEKETRKGMTDPTFFRQRRLLMNAGVSWIGADVAIVKTSIPVHFSLRRSDPRRIYGEADVVRNALRPFASYAA